ncbi:MAG TPA: MarR family winged helix-turn-helix transcriptional regulator [Chloroflexia bacterium]|nr:MarR family winged helix-turn-helix transcriptional regulator [Chloroflexia bacterium]
MNEKAESKIKKKHQNSYAEEFNESLAHNLVRLGHLMRQETQRCLRDLEVTPEQWQALVYLSGYQGEGGLTQNELAEITLKDKTTISRLVENMLKLDLLVRTEGEDRRTYRLQLSEKGRSIVDKAWPLIGQHFPQNVYTGLEKDEQAELLRLLQKLRRGMHDL